MIGRLEQYSQLVLEESLLAQYRVNVIRILDVENDQAYQLGNNCNRQECIKRNGKGLPKVFYQNSVPGAPLKGPIRSSVIQPPSKAPGCGITRSSPRRGCVADSGG